MDNEVSRDSSGKWLKGTRSPNPRGRTPSSVKLKKLLDPYKEELIHAALEKALNGDLGALKLCLERIAPSLKPEGDVVKLEGLADAKSFRDKSEVVLNTIARGEVSIDAGMSLMKVLSAQARIVEITDLENRLALLERAHLELGS